jgi:hypothetical protein
METKGQQDRLNIASQGAVDVTKIGAQGDQDRKNIGAQGDQDVRKIGATGTEERKTMQEGDKIEAQKSNRQSARSRSMARAF